MTFDEKLKYGNQLIKEDKYLEAFDIFCELSSERKDDAELTTIALYLFHQIVEGNYDFEPSTANEFLFRGVSKSYKNEYEGAILDYDKALALNPNLDVAYYNKGLNYARQGKFELAIKEIEKAISLNPVGTYYNEMAQQYFELRKFKDCFLYHEKALEKEPSNPFYWFTYGAHLSKGGNDANAFLKLQKAVELDPSYEQAQRALEHVYLRLCNL
jgi:tetratricopeptide (TPR) repeat protein